MNKKLLVFYFSVLLFSALAATQSVNLADANFNPWLTWFPTEPAKTQPTIAVVSPSQNRRYDSTSILLNFTLSKPKTWFSRTELSLNESYMGVVRVRSWRYVLDGLESQQNMSVTDGTLFYDTPEETFNFSTSLTLTEGEHSIAVIVESQSYYVVEQTRFTDIPKSIPLIATSEVTNFTVGPPEPKPEPFPTTLIAAITVIVAIAVVGVVILVYFRRIEKKRELSDLHP